MATIKVNNYFNDHFKYIQKMLQTTIFRIPNIKSDQNWDKNYDTI